ncbi:MAG: CPBP family intramembrane glutamic endopeptidase [Cyclobacteriaceae bacterium]
MQPTTLSIEGAKSEKVKLLLEVLLVATVFMTLRWIFSSIKYSSQIAEVISLVLITYLFVKRKTSWREVGFTLPTNWIKSIGLTILCIVSIGVIFNFVIQPLFPHGANEINEGHSVISFNEMLFQLFFIGIGAAAIGEEMMFRGFLLNHLNTLFGRNAIGTTLAILLQALIFGVLHSGVQGMVSAGVIGIILGTFYVLAGRNLLVVMVAHAVPDVLSIVGSYQSQ